MNLQVVKNRTIKMKKLFLLASILIFIQPANAKLNSHEIDLMAEKYNKQILSGDTKSVWVIKIINELTNDEKWVIGNDSLESIDTEVLLYIWEKKIIKSSFRQYSQTGDWYHQTDCYYYDNGNVGFCDDRHLSFNAIDIENDKILKGEFVSSIVYYFDTEGQILKIKKNSFNNENKKKIPSKYIRNRTGEIYKKISDFPFFKLLNY